MANQHVVPNDGHWQVCNGQIRDKDSFGNDPYPPKDTRF